MTCNRALAGRRGKAEVTLPKSSKLMVVDANEQPLLLLIYRSAGLSGPESVLIDSQAEDF
jgi:hypothetical protein